MYLMVVAIKFYTDENHIFTLTETDHFDGNYSPVSHVVTRIFAVKVALIDREETIS